MFPLKLTFWSVLKEGRAKIGMKPKIIMSFTCPELWFKEATILFSWKLRNRKSCRINFRSRTRDKSFEMCFPSGNVRVNQNQAISAALFSPNERSRAHPTTVSNQQTRNGGDFSGYNCWRCCWEANNGSRYLHLTTLRNSNMSEMCRPVSK